MAGKIFKLKDHRFGWLAYDNNDDLGLNFVNTNKNYGHGEDQFGNQYYIRYRKIDLDTDDKIFSIFPVEDDLYKDDYGNLLPVPWGKYYTDDDGVYHDPNDTWLPELEVYPKTGKLTLSTYYPLSKEYPYTGHSRLDIEPDYPTRNNINKYSYLIDKSSSDYDYKFITNNCADATREVLEKLIGKNMNPFLFTTPGDSRDFLLENGGEKLENGDVVFKLSEDQMIKLSEFIDNKAKEYYEKLPKSDNEISWYNKII